MLLLFRNPLRVDLILCRSIHSLELRSLFGRHGVHELLDWSSGIEILLRGLLGTLLSLSLEMSCAENLDLLRGHAVSVGHLQASCLSLLLHGYLTGLSEVGLLL